MQSITVTADAGIEGFANVLGRLTGLAFRVETRALEEAFEGVLLTVDGLTGTAKLRDINDPRSEWVCIRLDDPALTLTYL